MLVDCEDKMRGGNPSNILNLKKWGRRGNKSG